MPTTLVFEKPADINFALRPRTGLPPRVRLNLAQKPILMNLSGFGVFADVYPSFTYPAHEIAFLLWPEVVFPPLFTT